MSLSSKGLSLNMGGHKIGDGNAKGSGKGSGGNKA